MGARQIGKSTVVKQVLKNLDAPYQFSALRTSKFSIDMARRKASIPKLQVYNNTLER